MVHDTRCSSFPSSGGFPRVTDRDVLNSCYALSQGWLARKHTVLRRRRCIGRASASVQEKGRFDLKSICQYLNKEFIVTQSRKPTDQSSDRPPDRTGLICSNHISLLLLLQLIANRLTHLSRQHHARAQFLMCDESFSKTQTHTQTAPQPHKP